MNPVAPAAVPASTTTPASPATLSGPVLMPPRSHWADGQEHHAEQILLSAAGPLSMAPESGDDEVVGNGDTGAVKLGNVAEVDGAVEAASGKADSRSSSASGGSNDGNGKSKRMSQSADGLQQDRQLADVQIDKPPSSPHESRNPNTNIVARLSTPNQRPHLVIQNVDTDAGANAHSLKQEPDTDTPSSFPAGVLDSDPPM